MKDYKKRIAFLISDQHFIPHGGIGQFAKGFTEMANSLKWKVDILLDQAPTNKEFVKAFKDLGANIINPAPKEKQSYSDHAAMFMHGDSINEEKIINFRNVIMKALSTNLYDLVLCNTQESMTAAYILQLNYDIPVVFYTHLYSMIFRNHFQTGNDITENKITPEGSPDVFLENYHHFFNKHMEFPNIFIGTQSEKNRNALLENGSKFVSVLPIPLPERDFLEPNLEEREGVLFIGRWEEGKNPEAYIRVMKESKLPCKVLTSPGSAKKFEEAFKNAGIKDYTIKAGIVGKEKSEFVKSARVHFNPSLRESWGIGFMECMGHMPCVVLDNQEWSDNFLSIYYYKTSLEDASSLVTTLYSVMNPAKFYSDYGSFEYVTMLDELAPKIWYDFVNGYEGRKSKVKTAKIHSDEDLAKNGYVRYDVYIENLKRKKLSRIDFESVLTNRHWFTVKYCDKYTYIGKEENFSPENNDLFEF